MVLRVLFIPSPLGVFLIFPLFFSLFPECNLQSYKLFDDFCMHPIKLKHKLKQESLRGLGV